MQKKRIQVHSYDTSAGGYRWVNEANIMDRQEEGYALVQEQGAVLASKDGTLVLMRKKTNLD